MFIMVTKTITITEDAYGAIKRLKRESESFSDLFLRIGKKQITVKDLIGVCEGKGLYERFMRERQLLRESSQRRLDDVRARLKHSH